jgi:hypothetical protein
MATSIKSKRERYLEINIEKKEVYVDNSVEARRYQKFFRSCYLVSRKDPFGILCIPSPARTSPYEKGEPLKNRMIFDIIDNKFDDWLHYKRVNYEEFGDAAMEDDDEVWVLFRYSQSDLRLCEMLYIWYQQKGYVEAPYQVKKDVPQTFS